MLVNKNGFPFSEFFLFLFIQALVYFLFRIIYRKVKAKNSRQTNLLRFIIVVHIICMLFLLDAGIDDGTFLDTGNTMGISIPSYVMLSIFFLILPFRFIDVLKAPIMKEIKSWFITDDE